MQLNLSMVFINAYTAIKLNFHLRLLRPISWSHRYPALSPMVARLNSGDVSIEFMAAWLDIDSTVPGAQEYDSGHDDD